MKMLAPSTGMKREAVQEERQRKDRSESNNNNNNDVMVDAHQMNGSGPAVRPKTPQLHETLYQQQAAALDLMPIEKITEAEIRVDQKRNEVELHVRAVSVLRHRRFLS